MVEVSKTRSNRVNSVLARFEKTIQENDASGVQSNMYLTNSVSKPRKAPRPQLLKRVSSRRLNVLPDIDEDSNFCIDTISTSESTEAFDPFALGDDLDCDGSAFGDSCSSFNSSVLFDNEDEEDDFGEIEWDDQGSTVSGNSRGSKTSMVSHRSRDSNGSGGYARKTPRRQRSGGLDGCSAHSRSSGRQRVKRSELSGSSHSKGRSSSRRKSSRHGEQADPEDRNSRSSRHHRTSGRSEDKSSRHHRSSTRSDEEKPNRHHRSSTRGPDDDRSTRQHRSSPRSDEEKSSRNHRSSSSADEEPKGRTSGPKSNRRLSVAHARRITQC